MLAVNTRYLAFISAIQDNTASKKLQKIVTAKMENNRIYKGFNFFNKADQDVLVYLTSGEFNISGFRSKDLKKRFKNYSAFTISRLLKRL